MTETADTNLIWLTSVDYSRAKPHQWYYNNEPCEMTAVGVRKGENKPAAHRFKMASGIEVEVWWEDKVLPGVTYELLSHEPGHA